EASIRRSGAGGGFGFVELYEAKACAALGGEHAPLAADPVGFVEGPVVVAGAAGVVAAVGAFGGLAGLGGGETGSMAGPHEKAAAERNKMGSPRAQAREK
ncbi:MAG: hypothetical protein L6Q76_26060, partial [Polyangiaceae bacterium]|nr:hypothetical protein [Polyangiaceae bacterium]